MKLTNRHRNGILFVVLTVLLVAAVFFSLSVGKLDIRLWKTLAGKESPAMENAFWVLRFPRVMMALLAGTALGITGSIYQMIFKNPLASPDLLGVTGGANLGAALAIVVAGAWGAASVAWGAFLGGTLALLLVLLLAKCSGGNRAVTYILSGIVVNALASALIVCVKYFADPANELAAIEYWEMGTLGNITMQKLLAVLPTFFLSLAGVVLMKKPIQLMSLDDDESRSLGLPLYRARLAVLILNTLLVASAICMTGRIAFVGLIAPHIARLLIQRNDVSAVAFSGLLGAGAVLTADILARSVYTVEVPISLFTTAVAVPVLLLFMIQRGRKE